MSEKACRITGDFSSPPSGGRILPGMTRTQSGANWSDVPSLSHLWMAALLRLAAMVVSGAADPLRMLLTLLARECHTDGKRDRLPARKDGNQSQEAPAAATHGPSTEARMVSSERSSRPSNHEGALTSASQASRYSADALLPRTGEAPSVRTEERSGPGGGRPHRSPATPAPHRIVQASRLAHASLPRAGEDNRACVTS